MSLVRPKPAAAYSTHFTPRPGTAKKLLTNQTSLNFVGKGRNGSFFFLSQPCCLGVCFAGEGVVMTTSTDQRLNVWKVSGEGGGIELLSSHAHDVADPSSLAVYNTR